MPWTKTTPTEEDFSSLQSDIRLMEIAEDPAEFRNFLPGHLQENSSTSETTSFTQPVDRERTEATSTSSKPRCCESNPPSDELRVLEDDEEYRSMMRRLTNVKCYVKYVYNIWLFRYMSVNTCNPKFQIWYSSVATKVERSVAKALERTAKMLRLYDPALPMLLTVKTRPRPCQWVGWMISDWQDHFENELSLAPAIFCGFEA